MDYPPARLSRKLGGMAPDVLRCDISESAGYAQDWHAHDCHMLLLPRQGSLFLSTEHSLAATHLSRQSFSLVLPDLAHSTAAAPGHERHIALYVDPDYFAHFSQATAYGDVALRTNLSGVWQGSEVLSTILLLHDQLARNSSPATQARQQLHLNHLLFEECARLIAHAHLGPQHWEGEQNARLIREIQAYIREHLKDDLNLDRLCHEFHLSRRHLTRLFKAFTEETFVDFTHRTRVENAARLISSTHLSILDISLEVGIDSPSYLARLFKRYLGILPSDLRKGA